MARMKTAAFVFLLAGLTSYPVSWAVASPSPMFQNVSATHMPNPPLNVQAKDAHSADFNGDGRMDLFLANRSGPDLLLFGPSTADYPRSETVMTKTSDGVTIYGEKYSGSHDATAPLVLLFHQGGSNGRGEYAALAKWLNEAGFRAIAWDQRSGGKMYGETNRTIAGLPRESDPGYCDAYMDLQAALDYAAPASSGKKVVVWGSSYSASLVFRLAAENPDRVAGVIAFSPASGGPMVECRARLWVENVNVPVFVLRPASEMARDSSVEQRDILAAAGADFLVVENGVHGSSTLIDARTNHDMNATREAVLDWLRRTANPTR